LSKLRTKTISGVFWSLADNGVSQGLQFVVGIILARLLAPEEFGLIGMIMIFILLSESFINSGFSQALIRKKECTKEDYNTAFYFNLITSIAFYFILFVSAPLISRFYEQPALTSILRILGLILFFNAFSIVQQAILIRQVNFRLQTKITFFASILSGIIAIMMALKGFGVWSLVVKMLTSHFLRTFLLWIFNKWHPSLLFSKESFHEMFSFGYKLLFSSLINTGFRNIYYVVIGKYFSAAHLGFFSRADQFTKLPAHTMTKTLQRVAFPVLSEIQDDIPRLKRGYKKFIKVTMFANSAVLLLLAALAEPFILTLLGEKWIQTIPFLQLMCFAVLMHPIVSLNMNTLIVKGRSDIYLWLEIITKILIIPIVIIGVLTSIEIMIIGMVLHSIVNYLLIAQKTSKLIDYSIVDQLKDILPGFMISLSAAAIVVLLQKVTVLPPIYELLLFGGIGVGMVLVLSEVFKEEGYWEVRKVLIGRFDTNKIN
jgi:teichuronic acid exporter